MTQLYGSDSLQQLLLHMDDLWLNGEVQGLLDSGELKQPVNGHVVQPIHVKMGEMNLRARSCNNGSTLLM